MFIITLRVQIATVQTTVETGPDPRFMRRRTWSKIFTYYVAVVQYQTHRTPLLDLLLYIHYKFPMKKPIANTVLAVTQEINHSCLLSRARRISRVVTGIYDQEMRPYGINAPQFSLLVMISRLDGATRAEIGRANRQERSTLSRNLALLLKEGWVEEVMSTSRGRPIVISPEGKDLLTRVAPAWRVAQGKATELLGGNVCSSILNVGTRLQSHQYA